MSSGPCMIGVLLLCIISLQRLALSEEPENVRFNSIQDKNGRFFCAEPLQFKKATTPSTLWTLRFVGERILIGPDKSGKFLSYNDETKEVGLSSSDDPNASLLVVKVTAGKARPFMGIRGVIVVDGKN